MSFIQDFQTLDKDSILKLATERKDAGWRFANVLATKTLTGVDLTYSFIKDDKLENFQVLNLQPSDSVESIQSLYFNAFVFENEAHDLFGVQFNNMALDFGGKFYDLAIKEPMTILSPTQKAELDKAKSEKIVKDEGTKVADLEEKLKNMDPEKAAKVKAALAAKAKREAAAKGGE